MADLIAAGGAQDPHGVAPQAAEPGEPIDRSPAPQAISPPAVALASIAAPQAAWVESALAALSAHWLLLVALCASAVVQSASFSAFFFEDDYLHLFGLANGPTGQAMLATFGGHVMLTHKALLLAVHRVFGFEFGRFFACILVLHLVNVFLLFDVLRRLTSSRLVGAVGASLWGVLPSSEGALGWVSVFGQVMATTAILWLLRDVARLAEQKRAPGALAFARWGALVLVAEMSQGLGVVIGATLPLFVWLLLPVESARRRTALRLLPLVVLVPMLHKVLLALGEGTGGVVISKPAAAIRLFLAMMSYGTTSVLLGPVLTTDQSTRVIGALGGEVTVEGMLVLAQAVAGFAFVVLAGLFWRATSTRRRHMLAFLLLACAAYGALALGRAWVVGWHGTRFEQLATEPRYAYFPTLALSGLVALGLGTLPARWLSGRQWIGPAALCAWLAIVVAPARSVVANVAKERHETARTQAEEALSVVRAEASASPSADEAYIANDVFAGTAISMALGIKARSFPGLAALWVVASPDDSVDGRRLRFVEHDGALVEEIRARRPGTRIAQLLVLPEEVPPGIVPRTVVLTRSGDPAMERALKERADRDPEFRRQLERAIEERAQRDPGFRQRFAEAVRKRLEGERARR